MDIIEDKNVSAEEALSKFAVDWSEEVTNHVSFRVPSIDKIFTDKGLPVHGLTEIYGASSSGKTQIALHLTLSALVQRDSDGQTSDAKNRKPHVVYICTEGAFPMKRFVQLLDAYKSEQETENEQENCEDRIEDRLLLRHESTVESLLECITVRLPKLAKKLSIGMIVVDSIAAVFRCESRQDYSHVERSQMFFSLAASLKSISLQNGGCFVLVLNQVSDIFPEDILNVHHWLTAKKKPSLGLAWSNVVTTRIMVSTTDYSMPIESLQDNLNSKEQSTDTNDVSKQQSKVIGRVPLRRLDIIMSPYLARKSCFFVVDSSGIQGVE